MAGNWFTDLWESVFPKKQKYNVDELRAGMAKYVAAIWQPAPKKPAEKHPQSSTPIPKKPEKKEKPAQHSPRKPVPQEKPQYSMREDQTAYVVPKQERPAQYSEREPRVQFQKWAPDDDPVPELLRSSLNGSEAKALDIILEGRKEKTFRDKLFELIKARRVTDSHVYKRAQLDRRLFSKIAGDRYYRPAKDTVIALALALECSLTEANDLLGSAGYLLSHSSKRDIMIEYLFKEKMYDLTTANIILDQLKQKPIGR